jgi:PAS domain S-box-containing protein
MNKKTIKQYLQPATFAIISFFVLIIATISYTNFKQGQWEKDIRESLLDVLIGKKSKIEKALYSRIYYTRGVSAFVALKPEITVDEFNELAKEYIKNDTVIGTMSLSKNCILNAIYPLKGHEAAIGLNLLEHPERKEIVEKTIATHQTFIAGPVELVEGGIAFISYTPIFDKRNKGKELFWGMTDIVIKQDGLLNEVRFKNPENGYNFALRGYNGEGNDGAIFWGDKSVFNKKPVTINIDLPIGAWVLAGVPVAGWNQYPDQDKAILFILILSSFVISVLIWLFSRVLLKIRQNEKELKAILGSMDSLIVEYNARGVYVKIAPTNDTILFRSREDLIGKSLFEIFDREKADFLMLSIRQCLETKKLVVIEYPMNIKGKDCWFSARISYKSDDSVIFNAFDITEKKQAEQKILNSEIQLKELNEMKDKFFSIIAHDLRNPAGSMMAIINLILEEYSEMTDELRLELLTSMQLSSRNLHLLLEDLLNWSRAHSGKIVVNREMLELNALCEKIGDQLNSEARLKDIRLINETGGSDRVLADSDLTSSIIRNLVSNAIKFTERGGEIRIYSEKATIEQSQFLKISVADNGIGMKAEKLDSIFKIDQTSSTPGTDNEHGTGLGLQLCKELVEKQGGQIFVESKVGEGSIFSFTLPRVDQEV